MSANMKVIFMWVANPQLQSITSYHIYQATESFAGKTPGPSLAPLATIPPGFDPVTGAVQYVLNPVPQQKLYFAVTATNAGGQSGYSNEVLIDNSGGSGGGPTPPIGLTYQILIP